MLDAEYEAVVQKVFSDGRHGPYAVARSDSFGKITFSLNNGVWKEEIRPEPGHYVILSKLTKKRAGWRATQGRFFTPSDEKTENQTNRKTDQQKNRKEK